MIEYRKKINITCFIILVFSILLDQLTKYLAKTHLIDNSVDIIDNVFSLTYLENRGVGFGFLQNKMLFILIINIIVLILISVYFIRLPKTKRFFILHVLITLIVSGAIGNIIDRVSLGYVIDFFYFELIDFPIFNVADIYVTVSVFLLLILCIFIYSPEETDEIMNFGKIKKKEDSENE